MVSAYDLIHIGLTLGLDLSERVYLSLRDEPRDRHGNRIDWTTIRAKICAGLPECTR
jgi:hypothetical protein